MSQELVERIRKRKCFADKDLEQLAPTPQQQQQHQQQPQLQQETLNSIQDQLKFQEIYSYILSQKKFFSSLTENTTTENSVKKNSSHNTTENSSFGEANSFNTLNSFAAFYTQLLINANHANPMYNSFINESLAHKNLVKNSAFHEPKLFNSNNAESDFNVDNSKEISAKIPLMTSQCDSIKSNVLSNQNNCAVINATKLSSNEMSQKKIVNKLTNFSVEALLGVVK